ncbi:hypothetical protein AB4K20DRAFT_1964115 [Rhizopus microsporus]|uniref:Uncharacterized protein n=1 Tax=Rhizopus microsporus TaxID=58291 RepID=A0A1X0S6L0_RHIZD|nr:hypothetical protein BCV71DRAFT_289870 [Rhizopus microsporus]
MVQQSDAETESLTLTEDIVSKQAVKDDSESDKELILFSLNESLLMHKEMVERVQNEKDDAEDNYEQERWEREAKINEAKRALEEKQREQGQKRDMLETQAEQLKRELASRETEYRRMESKFQSHMRSAKASEDDVSTIQRDLNSLLQDISDLCEKIPSDFYHQSVGKEEDVETRWLVEKWVVQVMIDDILNKPIQPGVVINNAFGRIFEWVKKRNISWAVRMRQQITTFIVRQSNDDIEQAKKEIVEKIMTVLHFAAQSDIIDLVDRAVRLNLALKCQEALVEIMPIQEGGSFDSQIMNSVTEEEGCINLVIVPPFMEAMAKYVLKSLMSDSQRQQQQQQQQQLQQEQQQSKKKNWWWNKQPKPESILSLEEQRVLKRVKSRAHFLDRGVSCCCFQVGFDGIVGFIPVIGDFIGVLLALQLVQMAMQLDIPNELVSKMMFNIAFDFVIGLVPLAGDLLDIMYKCNTKNALLLENYLIKRRRKMMAHDTTVTTSAPVIKTTK